MAGFMKMVDMKRTDEEKAQSLIGASIPTTMAEDYPYGLRICLTEDELSKLDLEDECEIGDMIHISGMATVTSVSKTQNGDGSHCRIELTITHLGVEDEDAETQPSRMANRYGTDDEEE